jgi:hypothetical protein
MESMAGQCAERYRTSPPTGTREAAVEPDASSHTIND